MEDEETVPDLFKCPICLEILISPYTALCGHTCCQGCWMKLAGNQQKIDLIIGRISSLLAVDCPLCRRLTYAGPNHALRNHIQERYAKQVTDARYAEAVEQLREEMREEIQKEYQQAADKMRQEFDRMRHQERQTVASSLPTLGMTRRTRVRGTEGEEWIKRWFWKLVGFNGVMAILIAPILLCGWLYNAMWGR